MASMFMNSTGQTRWSACPACLLSDASRSCCDPFQLPQPTLPSTPVIIGLIVAYITALQLLRYRRAAAQAAVWKQAAPLTPETAQPIVHALAQCEFPFFHRKALQFALFRTYGIPTISGLLQKTSLFGKRDTAAKRYVDTTVLVSEFLGRRFGSEDWITPMARLNAIHGHYRDLGKIIEADMLYVLLLFAQQPWRWIDRFDWRSLSHAEVDALGTFWRGIGEAMEIDYTGLDVPGWIEDSSAAMTANGRGHGEWRDGAHWMRSVEAWAEKYEQKHMVPAESNAAVAEQTIALLLYEVPTFMHPFARHLVSSLMDKRLRVAMSIPDPPTWIHCSVHTLLAVRKYVVRYLFPPRPNFLKVAQITESWQKTPEGRHHMLEYDNVPYYVKATLGNRWGIRAWSRWLAGKPLPGDKDMNPEGYLADRVGPGVGRTQKEQDKRKGMVQDVLAGKGCPMAFR